MEERVVVHKGSYHDSAFLMRLARDLGALDGIEEAVVLMGTSMNLGLLEETGFAAAALDGVTPMDMVVALRAQKTTALDAAEEELDRLLRGTPATADSAGRCYASLAGALGELPDINLVSVAVPGAYAAFVADRALGAGRHVFLFSNNVSIEDEVRLKRRAHELGLLVMGPDCGTAIVAGVGLGFANRVRRGRVGLVGASGTGLQAVSSQVHALGLGVSQAIGTGSADLTSEVGGSMSEAGLRLLAADENTDVIVLVAKHPAAEVADRMQAVMAELGKPVVVRYLGQSARASTGPVFYAASLDEAACEAVYTASEASGERADPFCDLDGDVEALGGIGGDGRLVGLFGGGSLASEAALVLREAGLDVDEPDEPLRLHGGLPGSANLIVDTGEDFYTAGRPHPMVDQTVRCELIRGVLADPTVRLLLFDLVLGDGSHPDPAAELAHAVRAGRHADGPLVVASVTGTELDPQDINRQVRELAGAGVHVQPTAARAARVAAALMGGRT